MTRRLCRVEVEFYADEPDDEAEADVFADRLAESIAVAIDEKLDVISGSVRVIDWNSYDEAEARARGFVP